MAMEIYEVAGLVGQVSSKLDQTAVNFGTSPTASTASLTPSVPNVYAFAGVAIGTAAQQIIPINTSGTLSNWINDSNQLNPTTPAGLFSFISMSELLDSLDSRTASATIQASEPWAMVVAVFRPIAFPVMASVNLNKVGGVAIVTGGLVGSQGVGGLAANAAAPVGNPNLIAGYDSAGAVVRRVKVDGSGNVVDPSLLAVLTQILGEIRALRLATIEIARADGLVAISETDFDPDVLLTAVEFNEFNPS